MWTIIIVISSVQSLSRVRLFVTPWTAAHQASLSITNSQSLLKLMSIESVMPSNHLILCRPLLFPPSIFPSIRVFSHESALRIRWPKYWNSFCHYYILLEVVSPFVCCRKVSPVSVISTYPSSLLPASNTSTLLVIKSHNIHETFCGFSRSHRLLSPLQVTPAYIRHLSTEPLFPECHHFLLNQVPSCAVVSNPSFLRNGLLLTQAPISRLRLFLAQRA